MLVVDDEAIVRMNAAEHLELEGYEVLEAENAAAALAALAVRPDVGVLFTDVHMPGELDGMELAREVHARWPDILILVTSGRLRPSNDDIPDDGRFLPKPYMGEALTRSVAELIERHA